MELTKAQKKELRALLDTGWERSLATELRKLDESFADWRSGKVDSFELSERIHRFHNGPSRDLYSRFTIRGMDQVTVAALIVDGVLEAREVSDGLLQALSDQMQSIRGFGEPGTDD
jgi:hypothetical protein